jgi:hypothetical protein
MASGHASIVFPANDVCDEMRSEDAHLAESIPNFVGTLSMMAVFVRVVLVIRGD